MRRPVVLAVAGVTFTIALVLCLVGVGDDPTQLTNWQALVLGLVQGMTELLPISSSAHLIIVPWLFEWTYLEQNDAFNQTFDVSIHLGTCVAVGAYFWHDVTTLLVAWLRTLKRRSIGTSDERLAWVVLVATIPAAVLGFLLEDVIASRMGEPWQIAIFLTVFGLLLGWADRRPQQRTMGDLTLRKGLLVGLAQSMALMPGVSRSGITITAGRLLGLDRDSAARFSFLLLLPITLGAVVFKGLTDVVLADLPSGMTGPFVVGVLASLASGLVAILFLLDYVRRHTYDAFVVYRLIASAVILLLIITGIRAATF
ncbi:MAG: undecaprenyl-diphosphatase UppP [Thermoleophilia bacterium]|nr:undecaprenyl-diphosphatase UppP [Thermoleophilia bacterium]